MTQCISRLVTHKKNLKEVIESDNVGNGPWIFVEKVEENEFVVTAVVRGGGHSHAFVHYGHRFKLLEFRGSISEDASGRDTLIDGGFRWGNQIKYFVFPMLTVFPIIILWVVVRQWLAGCISSEAIGPISLVLGMFSLLGFVPYLRAIGPKRRVLELLSQVLGAQPDK